MDQKKSRRKKKNRKLVTMLTSFAFIMMFGVAGTIAYLTTQTEPLVNTFEPVNDPPKIIEEFDGKVKSNVRFQNEGNIDAYIRAVIVLNWVDEDGNICGSQAVSSADYNMELNVVPDGENDGLYWKKLTENDPYYYWPAVVAPEEYTEVLIKSCQVASGITPPDGYYLSVEILTETIQAEPVDAIRESWGDAVVDGDILILPALY